jgi:hypothetical protein
MRKLSIALSAAVLFASCEKEEFYPEPCTDCLISTQVDTNVSPGTYTDTNGYVHVPHNGLTYFTIESQMSNINEAYVVNGVPMIEVDWDSDYWVVFNSIGFQYSLYSLFGYYDASGTPIPVGDTIYYWNNINPPTNIVGYEYNSNRKRGIQTKYSYYSRKHIFFDNEMVGDTATIYTRAVWNNDIVGPRKEVLDSLKIIFQ